MLTSSEPVGLLKKGTIVRYIKNRGILQVALFNAPSIKGSQALPVEVQAPHALFYNNGLFIGTLPVEGTPVVVGQGVGGKYHFVSFLAENLPIVPNLTLGELLLQSNDDTYITLNVKNDITIGSSLNNIHINTDAKYISTNFNNEYNFTQASRKVVGVVKRDTVYYTQFSQESKLEKDNYDSKFEIIGLDPGVPVTNNISGSNKNPAFVENREMIYEFQYSSNISDDLNESNVYGIANQTATNYTYPNRRISRADTLSLSLVAPNYLIETIKGTVVDIFGNLIDLNREVLPVGQGQATINKDQSSDKVKSFFLIKELERKSLAFHFEINARKDLTSKSNNLTLPDVNSNDNYSRSRSSFFLDIDKEGQFKLNVPASSEKGNVPLLTRYENYSTYGIEDNNNPNKLFYRSDKRDIFQDSFASPLLTPSKDSFEEPKDKSKGSINLIGSDSSSSAPTDRITKKVIKHGTAYHDIMQTCFVHQNNQFLHYQPDTNAGTTCCIGVKATIEVFGSAAHSHLAEEPCVRALVLGQTGFDCFGLRVVHGGVGEFEPHDRW